MRTAGGNMNHTTPTVEESYKVGDVVEVVEENPMCSGYHKGQLVNICTVDNDNLNVQAICSNVQMRIRTRHVKHPVIEGYPEQARVERGYWTGQMATDEIDTPMRSLNDVTPYEWDQVSKDLTAYGTGAMFVGGDSINHIPAASLFKTEEDEPDGFDIPDLNLQAANPLDTQIGGDHYRHMEIQPIEFITSNKLGWCEGHVVKYVSRHASKGGKQDLEKAKHYIDMLIEEVYYD